MKRFQDGIANNLTLVAAAGMAVGTIALCCGWACYPENCDPSVTLGPPDGSRVCSDSVAAEALTTCDDEDDIVKVINSIKPETQLTYNQIMEGHFIWDGTAPLGVGMNRLKATAGECERVSSEVDVPSNGGSGPSLVWSGTPTSIVKCQQWGFDSILQACCLPQNQATTGNPANGPYSIQESVVMTSHCASVSDLTQNKLPNYSGTDANGCMPPITDSNYATPPGLISLQNLQITCGCSVDITQTITVAGSGFSQTFTDSGSVTYGGCPNGTAAIMTLSGDAIGGSVSTTNTVTCY